MEPLQLEESNDASDEATALMSQAAASVAAALQQPSTRPATPKESDRSLEGDLIHECRRLENAPPTERGMTRQELILSLFGEDSENGPPARHPKASATEAPTGSKPAKRRTARAKKTTAEKQGDDKEPSAEEPAKIAAKKATVSKSSMSRSKRKRGRSINSSSEDEAGSIDQQRTPAVVAKEDDETIIRELLSLARIKGIGDSAPVSKKRKRSLSPRKENEKLDLGSITPPTKRLPPSSGTKCPPSDVKSPGSEVTRDIASTSIEASFSQEEMDANVTSEQSPKKKTRVASKADKGKRKQLARATAMKLCSPIPKIIRNTVIKTPAAATPVRLFKPATPFGRLTGSRSRHRTPAVRRRRAITSNVPAEGRELQLSSIPEELALYSAAAVESNNQPVCNENQVPLANACVGEVVASEMFPIDFRNETAKQTEESRDIPSSSVSIIHVANNQDVAVNVKESIPQISVFNESTVFEDIRSPQENEEPSSVTQVIIPVSPVARSSDLSATVQPVNPPVDLPGPSRGRVHTPTQTEKSAELVDSSRNSSNNKQTPETSISKKQSKKRHSDPKLQSYLLLNSVRTKPPKTSQPQLDPVPFQAAQNNLVAPESSSIASNSPTVISQDVQTHRSVLVKKVRSVLQLTTASNIYSQ